MKPGSNPMFNLARAILSKVNPKAGNGEVLELVRNLKRERTSAILNLIRPLREEKNANFFLLVDQFEELFRFSMKQKDAERKAQAIDFVNLILNLSKQKILPFYVVLTMRSDFIGDCTRFRNLPEAMNESQFLVPRITRQDLKKIIEGPARLYGMKVDPRLTVKVINDLGKVQDELPLLQHAMMRIWDYETNINKSGALDLEDYRQVGGIEEALSQHADEALSRMNKEEISISEELFQALTAIDENGRKIRRPLLLSDLKELTGENEKRLLSIIDNFIRDRRSFLIVQDTGKNTDKLIDISHESLIRQWYILGLWVDAENRSATNYLRLVEASELFHSGEKDYLTGTELAGAVAWRDDFNPTAVWAERYREGFVVAMTYLRQSERERDALLIVEKKRKRRLRILAGVIMGLILLFGIYAISSNISIREQKTELETANEALNDANERIKATATSDSISKVEAIRQKVIAEEALESVDSALRIAVEQRKIADGAKILADLEAANAKVQEALARAQKDTAQLQYERAETLRISADQKKEAYEMYFEAKRLASKDPTMALRLYEAAMKKDPNPDFKTAAQSLINNQTFYKTIADINAEETNSKLVSLDISTKDGSVIMGDDQGIIRKWDKSGNKEFEVEAYERNSVVYLSFGPDGSTFMSKSGDSDSDWDIWRKKDGRVNEYTREIYTSGPIIDNSSDGTLEAHLTEDSVQLIDPKNGEVINELKNPTDNERIYVSSLSISPNGNHVFIVYGNSKDGVLWEVRTNRTLELIGHERDIISAAFSDDGKFIATGAKDASARLWDLKGESIAEFHGQWTNIQSVAIAPDASSILTGGHNGTVWLWDSNGELIKEYVGHTTSVEKVAYTDNGNSIITASLDGTAKKWKLEEVVVAKMTGHKVSCRSVAYSPDGRFLLTGAKNHANLWDSKGNFILKTEAQGNFMIYAVTFTPDGKSFVTGSDDGTVRVWGLDGKMIRAIPIAQTAIHSIDVSPDGEWFLVGFKIGWAVSVKKDGSGLDTGIRVKSVIQSVAISPGGQNFITGSKNGVAQLWSTSGDLLQEFIGHQGNIQSVTFAPDGQSILTGSYDHTAILWKS